MTDECMQLSSSKSLQVSLEQIRFGIAGLNARRVAILKRVPCPGDWARFEKECISTKDIAYLSAKTNDEFAILRSKSEDILFHGTHSHCQFEGALLDLILSGKLRLFAHTHIDRGYLVASSDDRNFLKVIGQKNSIIVSAYNGQECHFSVNLFDDERRL